MNSIEEFLDTLDVILEVVELSGPDNDIREMAHEVRVDLNSQKFRVIQVQDNPSNELSSKEIHKLYLEAMIPQVILL